MWWEPLVSLFGIALVVGPLVGGLLMFIAALVDAVRKGKE